MDDIRKRKICIVTGTRAEYGLLYWLMKEIQADQGTELQVLVTGMHLSPKYGSTWKQIEQDGFPITKKVEIELLSDTPAGIGKSMGQGVAGCAQVFSEMQPDIVVLLGDRFETFSAATAALISKIPIAHIHGGELTEGAYDDAIRHAITKMAHFHFTSAEVYRRRVIQLGEHPNRVFNVGAMGIDNIKKLSLMSKLELEESTGFTFGKKNLLVTFHPTTLDSEGAEAQFSAVLEALNEFPDIHLIFTKPNMDVGSNTISDMIDDYVGKNSARAAAFTSLGQVRYLSALKYVDAVVGNSSSGIIEVPSFKIGTINIGDRQKGRIKAESVIDCEPTRQSLVQAINEVYRASFRETRKSAINPYGDGGAAHKVADVLKSISLAGVLKKGFYDVELPAKL